jgi:hypothetical protein
MFTGYEILIEQMQNGYQVAIATPDGVVIGNPEYRGFYWGAMMFAEKIAHFLGLPASAIVEVGRME